MMTKRISVAALALCGFAVAASAQAGEGRAQIPPQRGQRGGARAGGRAAQRTPEQIRTQQLRQQVRQAFDEKVRKELNLTDEQAQRLKGVDAEFQRRRGELNRDELLTRKALGEAMADSAGKGDPAKINQYLAQITEHQHQRANLLDEEQKELGTFLTPQQRARYMALRQQLNRAINQINLENGGAARGMPPGPPPER